MGYVIADFDQYLHLYWRIDDYNLEDGGTLRLNTGQPISIREYGEGRGGRLKINLFDWNRDGKTDLLLATDGQDTIPDKDGIPGTGGAMILLMPGVGDRENIQFARPRPLRYKGETVRLGCHAASVAPYPSEHGEYGALVTCENGRMYLVQPEDISWGQE